MLRQRDDTAACERQSVKQRGTRLPVTCLLYAQKPR